MFAACWRAGELHVHSKNKIFNSVCKKLRRDAWQRHSRWSGTSSKMAAGCFSSARVSEKVKQRLCLCVGGEQGWRESFQGTVSAQCLQAALQRALLEDSATSRRSAGWAHCNLASCFKNWCGWTPLSAALLNLFLWAMQSSSAGHFVSADTQMLTRSARAAADRFDQTWSCR